MRGKIEYKIVLQIFKPFSNLILKINPTWQKVVANVQSLPIKTITASNVYSNDYGPEKAIDGLLNTDWAMRGASPATLTLVFHNPELINSIWFLSRKPFETYQGWKKIKAYFFYKDRLILDQDFNFSNASKSQVQNARFKNILVDEIELYLLDPVIVKPNGRPTDHPLDSGYTEILVERGNL